jgi:AcrR family transcriptional regulator
VSPQRSNRSRLIEGTLRCLERLPPERITARAIAGESGANLASINYHFGSKDDLVTEAVIEGLDRWLEEVASGLGDVESQAPAERYRRAGEVVEATRRRHTGLARNMVGALAKAQHDPRIREMLAGGFDRTTRPAGTRPG